MFVVSLCLWRSDAFDNREVPFSMQVVFVKYLVASMPVMSVMSLIKRTVARDFQPLVFFMSQPHMNPWVMPEIISNSQRFLISKFFPGVWYSAEFIERGIKPHRNLFRGAWYLAEINQNPRILIIGGLIPCRKLFISVRYSGGICFDGYVIPLACWWPRRILPKGFESLPLSLKGYFFKTVCM
jgi:hypothetical protein